MIFLEDRLWRAAAFQFFKARIGQRLAGGGYFLFFLPGLRRSRSFGLPLFADAGETVDLL
jgi:hypothetical protein